MAGVSAATGASPQRIEHSPIPWGVEKEGSNVIRDVEGSTVAHAYGIRNDMDAEFIARACNAHAELVIALRLLQEFTCMGRECLCAENASGKPCPPCVARAALFRATGVEPAAPITSTITSTAHAAAAALGRRGGQSTSEAKRAAVRANGAKGGRPRLEPKKVTPTTPTK